MIAYMYVGVAFSELVIGILLNSRHMTGADLEVSRMHKLDLEFEIQNTCE